MLAHNLSIWMALISIVVPPISASAQDVQISCDQYARDYSNIVAPRSGGAVIATPMTQYPGNNQRSSQNPQARGNTEWQQMVTNQDAYRMAEQKQAVHFATSFLFFKCETCHRFARRGRSWGSLGSQLLC